MLAEILPDELFFTIIEQFKTADITEVRLRTNKVVYCGIFGKFVPLVHNGEEFVASQALLDSVVLLATGNSMYAVAGQLLNGFINCSGGVRVGVSGEAVIESDGTVTAIKNINSICIRVPHEVKGCLKTHKSKLVDNPRNTLIVSPPGGGKTTYLRELTRLVSNTGKNILVIDERGELASVKDGVPSLDIGNCTDIFSNIPKKIAYQNSVRAMSPDIIVTDEIFGINEVQAILDILRCGVSVFASMHADSLEAVQKNTTYRELIDSFSNFVVLSKYPNPGTVKEVICAG